ALANDDLAGVDGLTAEALHAQVLGVRVAAVAGGASALLVCHELFLALLNASDLETRQVLTVSDALAVAGLVLVLEDVDLGSALVTDDLSGHGDLGESLRVRRHVVAVNEQQRGQLHG